MDVNMSAISSFLEPGECKSVTRSADEKSSSRTIRTDATLDLELEVRERCGFPRFPNHKTVESEGFKRGVFYPTADSTTVEREAETTLLMSTSDGTQLKKMTFQVANVNRALVSVPKMVRNGNRVVFDTSGSYIENKMSTSS